MSDKTGPLGERLERSDTGGIRTGTTGHEWWCALPSTHDDVKGHRRSAGTFVTESEAVRAWQRAEDRQADGRGSETRRTG
jgi:hypothetical protein